MSALVVPPRLRFALRRGTWRHLGRRARWRLEPQPHGRTVPLSWPVPPEVRETMRIRWPRQYGWPNAGGWVDPIKRGIAGHVPIEHSDLPQPAGNVVLFEAHGDAGPHRIVIDYDDQLTLNDSAREADLYFKLQYLREGYGTPTVRPGGYVTKQPALYRYARQWRALRERSEPSIGVLGRFGMRWAQGIRGQALALLTEQRRFEFQGGATQVWWGEYMDEMCQSRVCVDLPGNGEFCYRLVEYLAIGACVVGPDLATEMPVPLESGVHLVRVPRTLDELIDWCEKLLEDEALRGALQRSAADYFDRYLALDQLGAYYVDSIWRVVKD